MKSPVLLLLILLLINRCNSEENDFDASGAFESVETVIATEASGIIQEFKVEEGQVLRAHERVGYIDTVQLYLRKKQLEAQISATLSQRPDIPIQLIALEAELKEAELTQARMENLVKANATKRKDLDDANTAVEVLQGQIRAVKSSLGITTATLNRDVLPLVRQIQQINDQLKKSKIINPIHGTVLTKYAQRYEVAVPGRSLYRIAEIDTLILRAYVTGAQLSGIKLNEKVTVRADNGAKRFRTYSGILYWVSDKSEFTPKTIQTKEERADLVYAVKIRVVNDGYLKIGTYGDVKLK
jgi:HlyD family secretion protein